MLVSFEGEAIAVRRDLKECVACHEVETVDCLLDGSELQQSRADFNYPMFFVEEANNFLGGGSCKTQALESRL